MNDDILCISTEALITDSSVKQKLDKNYKGCETNSSLRVKLTIRFLQYFWSTYQN